MMNDGRLDDLADAIREAREAREKQEREMSQMTTEEILEKYPRPWTYEGVAESMWFEIRASNGSILSGADGKPVRFQGPSDAVLDPRLVNVCLSAINEHLVLGNNSQTDSVESRG